MFSLKMAFKKLKHVAGSHLKLQLIKVVLDCIYYYFIYFQRCIVEIAMDKGLLWIYLLKSSGY